MSAPKTQEDALAYFEALKPSVIKLGLDRVEEALSFLHKPHQRYVSIQVAGTNGKGSTCAFIAECLRAQGYRVGLYTSPHLSRVTERIRVLSPNSSLLDAEISLSVFATRIVEVAQRIPNDLPLTYFEFGTLVALWHFSKAKIDIAVLETGLGGRLDATTAAEAQVSAITSVSFDHQQFLGDTLPKIASEKAGIIRSGRPVVVSRQDPEALEVISNSAAQKAAPMRLEERDFSFAPEHRADTFVFRGKGQAVNGLRLGLKGVHQQSNAAVALAVLEELPALGFSVSPQAMRQGLLQTRWPGRLEWFDESPPVLLDGAHNVDGVRTLVEEMGKLNKPVFLVFGVLEDKDFRPMIEMLFSHVNEAWVCPLPSPRALSVELGVKAGQKNCAQVHAADSVGEALAAARRKAAAVEGVVVCAGSLVLVGQVRELLT